MVKLKKVRMEDRIIGVSPLKYWATHDPYVRKPVESRYLKTKRGETIVLRKHPSAKKLRSRLKPTLFDKAVSKITTTPTPTLTELRSRKDTELPPLSKKQRGLLKKRRKGRRGYTLIGGRSPGYAAIRTYADDIDELDELMGIGGKSLKEEKYTHHALSKH